VNPRCAEDWFSASAQPQRARELLVAQNAPQDVWFLSPDDSDQVIGPGGTKSTPCKDKHVISLAALDNSRALLLCTGRAVVTTSDGSMSWKKVGNLPSTMAVAGAGSRYWAVAWAKACDGVVVRSLIVEGDHLSPGPSRCAKQTKVSVLGGAGNAIWLCWR
jgi:hypothetical protein